MKRFWKEKNFHFEEFSLRLGMYLTFHVESIPVFSLSRFQMEKLEQVRNKCLLKSVLKIQSCWRRHKRKVAKKRMAAAVIIQSGEGYHTVFHRQN